MLCLPVILVALSCATAQKLSFGGCPDVTLQTNFDVSKYTGVWYEIEKNPAAFEGNAKCIQAVYESKGDYVSVTNKAVNEKTGEQTEIHGKATVPDANEPAKLKVQFDNIPLVKGDYWVVSTDYDNYSVVYSCFSPLKFFKAEFLWVLSRQKTLDDAAKSKVNEVLDQNKIDRSGLVSTVQDC